jgi:hypothetical protein
MNAMPAFLFFSTSDFFSMNAVFALPAFKMLWILVLRKREEWCLLR